VLVFTSEEVWSTRFPDEGSVHLLEWPDLSAFGQPGLVPGQGFSSADGAEGSTTPEQVRGDNNGSDSKWDTLRTLRERVTEAIEPLRRDKVVRSGLEAEVTVPADAVPEGLSDADLAELFISGPVTRGAELSVSRTEYAKCGRCWRLLPEVTEDGALCGRCTEVVDRMDASA
jgi:isoleucyl-tRNA synthetase